MSQDSSVSAERSLLRGLTVLQRSRSLRDPSMSPQMWSSHSTEKHMKDGSLNCGRRSLGVEHQREVRRFLGSSLPVVNQVSSKVAATEAVGDRDDGSGSNEVEEGKNNHTNDCLVGRRKPSPCGRDWCVAHQPVARKGKGKDEKMKLEDFSADSEHIEFSHVHHHGCLKGSEKMKRPKSGGSRRAWVSCSSKDLRAKSELSIASNTLVQVSTCQNCDVEVGEEEYVRGRLEASQAPSTRCGIPWNLSRIHHRGKTCVDIAERSSSCGLSNSKLRRTKEHVPQGQRDVLEMPVLMPEPEELPLLTAKLGSWEYTDFQVHDSSGELDIFSGNYLRLNPVSDPNSDMNSGNQCNSEGKGHERHQSLTEKYMPRTFQDLVGQNLVVRALSNAILQRKIGSLYVFFGPRGTGKTSCARLFARALNCQSPDEPKPCSICASCIAHDLGKSQNVQEMNPVDNFNLESIMDLLESMLSSKMRSQYRVLIIDDYDTLPLDSWSSISKVIDIAPCHVVFVLVGTILDRLPHTIISRCQKFFFQKLKDADIIDTLQWVADREGLEIGKDALKLIASRSGGSLMDAEMTLDQLSLLGRRISLSLVQELVGLISDVKLVDLLDSALSADTINTIKNLRGIMEAGVEPLELMSQLATMITDILAGSYVCTTETLRRRFFRRSTLSKKHMETLRQALKILSESEKQLRVSSDRFTWLTAALLQLAPDQQYILPGSSADSSFNQSLIAPNDTLDRDIHRKSNVKQVTGNLNDASGNDGFVNGNWARRKKHVRTTTPQTCALSPDTTKSSRGQIRNTGKNEVDEIWLAVLDKIQLNSLRQFICQEGKLISVSFGSAPTVQLMFSSHGNKCKAEKLKGHILQAFESVLGSPVTIEIRCEFGNDVIEEVQVPLVFPSSKNGSDQIVKTSESLVKNKKLDNGLENQSESMSKDRVGDGAGSSQDGHFPCDCPEISKNEIVAIGSSRRELGCNKHVDDIAQLGQCSESVLTEAATASHHQASLINLPERCKIGGPQVRSSVRQRVTLAQLLQQAEECTQRNGLIICKAVSIAKKLEKQNLIMEPRSRRLCCWKASRIPYGKLPHLRIRTRKRHFLLKLFPCARCLCAKSSRLKEWKMKHAVLLKEMTKMLSFQTEIAPKAFQKLLHNHHFCLKFFSVEIPFGKAIELELAISIDEMVHGHGGYEMM